MKRNSYRVLSHDERRILNSINTEISKSRDELSHINYGIQDVDVHFTDRINDRDIWVHDAYLVISFLLKNKLCQLIHNCEVDGKPFIKFAVVYDTDFILLCTCRTIRDGLKLIKFNSIIRYTSNQIYQGFVMKINKLVKKPEFQTKTIEQDQSWADFAKNSRKFGTQ